MTTVLIFLLISTYVLLIYVHYVSLCSYLPPLTSAKPAYGSSVLDELDHIRRQIAS